jgi:hypothetical protein
MSDKIKEIRARNQAIVQRALNTPDGQALMELLTKRFDATELRGPDPYDTYYRVGQRDLVVWLQQTANGEGFNE